MFRHPGLVPLSRDHHHALALCVRTDRALAADSSPGALAQAAAAIVQKFDDEIHDHFNFEERVLFPVLAGFEALAPVVVGLKAEHARIKAKNHHMPLCAASLGCHKSAGYHAEA